jgi:hypothetical protein
MKDKNTYCCIYHIELNELRLAFNPMRQKNIIHNEQLCDYQCDGVCGLYGQPCQASYVAYKGITDMWEAIACPKGEYEEWHKRNYLFGDYPSCGVHKLSLCLK